MHGFVVGEVHVLHAGVLAALVLHGAMASRLRWRRRRIRERRESESESEVERE